jgi:hypothetical protein
LSGFQATLPVGHTGIIEPFRLDPKPYRPQCLKGILPCAVLWPMVLGKEHPFTVREFLWMYRVQKNPKTNGVYNFQSKRGKFVQIEVKFSSNRWWKNRFFFAMRQWEFAPYETVEGPRVPQERSLLALDAHKEPLLSKEEIVRVNKVLARARIHEDAMYYNQLVIVTKLNMYLYFAVDTVGRSRKRLAP